MCIFQAQRSTAHARHAAAAAEPQKNGVTVQDVEKVRRPFRRAHTICPPRNCEQTCWLLISKVLTRVIDFAGSNANRNMHTARIYPWRDVPYLGVIRRGPQIRHYSMAKTWAGKPRVLCKLQQGFASEIKQSFETLEHAISNADNSMHCPGNVMSCSLSYSTMDTTKPSPCSFFIYSLFDMSWTTRDCLLPQQRDETDVYLNLRHRRFSIEPQPQKFHPVP